MTRADQPATDNERALAKGGGSSFIGLSASVLRSCLAEQQFARWLASSAATR